MRVSRGEEGREKIPEKFKKNLPGPRDSHCGDGLGPTGDQGSPLASDLVGALASVESDVRALPTHVSPVLAASARVQGGQVLVVGRQVLLDVVLVRRTVLV